MGKRKAHGRVCLIEGCPRRDAYLGLCSTHARRFQQGLRLDEGIRLRRRGSAAQRFEAQVDKNGPVPETAPELGRCWIWTGVLQPNGYTSFNADGQRSAHRWSYLHFKGSIPKGYHVHHVCRVPACVNPAHLEAVLPIANMRARVMPTPSAHCSRGHLFDEANTYLHPVTGWRSCRACNREKQRDRNAAYRAAHPLVPKTRCKNGHDYTPENTYVYPNGARSCRICRRLQRRKGLAKPRQPPY